MAVACDWTEESDETALRTPAERVTAIIMNPSGIVAFWRRGRPGRDPQTLVPDPVTTGKFPPPNCRRPRVLAKVVNKLPM